MAVTLRAEKREGRGKEAARKLRSGGKVPAVLYGSGTDSVAISVDAREAEYLFQSISVENTIVDLAIEGEKAPVQTLVREIQVHPWRPIMLHVDFLLIRKGVKIELEIPIHLVGIPEGVRNAGGVLQLVIHELPVRCLPTEIPESIEVDVTALGVGDSIHVSDLSLPEGVEVLVEADQTICAVGAPRVMAEEGAAEGEAGAKPEAASGGEEDEEG